jgi:hypothetical protein
MADPYEFPTDLGDDVEPPRDAMRWSATVIGLSTLGLALLNPEALDGWVNDVPPSLWTLRLSTITGAYAEGAENIGLGTAHARMHRAWKKAERADWSGRQPVETADASNPKS